MSEAADPSAAPEETHAVDGAGETTTAPIPPHRRVLPRSVTVALMLPFLVFIAFASSSLWREARALMFDMTRARNSGVVGYTDIHPNPSYATRPRNWYREEGDVLHLWSGWKDNAHQWFRVKKGDLARERLTLPVGRDTVRAIDHPILETEGGDRWIRLPDDAPVIGLRNGDSRRAYPLRLLDKVQVINDAGPDQPFLVTFTPAFGLVEGVILFDPNVEGQRLTMGLTGYHYDQKPLLYDRGTESLWMVEETELVSLGGPKKGTRLKSLGRPTPVRWASWRDENPTSQLIVGADRKRTVPAN